MLPLTVKDKYIFGPNRLRLEKLKSTCSSVWKGVRKKRFQNCIEVKGRLEKMRATAGKEPGDT